MLNHRCASLFSLTSAIRYTAGCSASRATAQHGSPRQDLVAQLLDVGEVEHVGAGLAGELLAGEFPVEVPAGDGGPVDPQDLARFGGADHLWHEHCVGLPLVISHTLITLTAYRMMAVRDVTIR